MQEYAEAEDTCREFGSADASPGGAGTPASRSGKPLARGAALRRLTLGVASPVRAATCRQKHRLLRRSASAPKPLPLALERRSYIDRCLAGADGRRPAQGLQRPQRLHGGEQAGRGSHAEQPPAAAAPRRTGALPRLCDSGLLLAAYADTYIVPLYLLNPVSTNSAPFPRAAPPVHPCDCLSMCLPTGGRPDHAGGGGGRGRGRQPGARGQREPGRRRRR